MPYSRIGVRRNLNSMRFANWNRGRKGLRCQAKIPERTSQQVDYFRCLNSISVHSQSTHFCAGLCGHFQDLELVMSHSHLLTFEFKRLSDFQLVRWKRRQTSKNRGQLSSLAPRPLIGSEAVQESGRPTSTIAL